MGGTDSSYGKESFTHKPCREGSAGRGTMKMEIAREPLNVFLDKYTQKTFLPPCT